MKCFLHTLNGLALVNPINLGCITLLDFNFNFKSRIVKHLECLKSCTVVRHQILVGKKCINPTVNTVYNFFFQISKSQ